ncbi:MAG: hypothetical protein EBU46_18875, partial [Nitrosomonadaceae bacterium]|nr:hypothetical protein [Nitrosomonadaceae bacterium]
LLEVSQECAGVNREKNGSRNKQQRSAFRKKHRGFRCSGSLGLRKNHILRWHSNPCEPLPFLAQVFTKIDLRHKQ